MQFSLRKQLCSIFTASWNSGCNIQFPRRMTSRYCFHGSHFREEKGEQSSSIPLQSKWIWAAYKSNTRGPCLVSTTETDTSVIKSNGLWMKLQFCFWSFFRPAKLINMKLLLHHNHNCDEAQNEAVTKWGLPVNHQNTNKYPIFKFITTIHS